MLQYDGRHFTRNFSRILLLVGALLFVCVISDYDITAQYRFDSWTTDNGLPQVSINSILQTRDGFLWFTTYGGLVRYDGMRFQVFNTGNTKGLRTGRFQRLFEDKGGALWISTEGQGITKYKDGNFENYTTEHGLGSNWIERISEDENGNILLQSADGLTLWNSEKFSSYSPANGEPFKNIFQRTTSGGIWYLEDSKLRKFENGRVTVDFAAQFPVRRAFEDSQGRVWLAGNGTVLSMLKDNKLTIYSVKDGYPQFRLNTVLEDRQNRLWFGTRGGGLLLLKDEKFTRFTTADGLAGDDVGWIYEDREGTFWIGTTGGLSRMTERTVTSYSAQDGLAADNVYPIYEDRAGKIWIGSWRGLTVYDKGIFTDVGKQFGVADVLVTSLLEDSEGNLWIGSWSEGVRRIKDGKSTFFPPNEMPGVHVRVIYQDRAGNIWFGTSNGLVNFKDGIFTSYTAKDGFPGSEIFVIYEDRQRQLWIGTDVGLSKFRDGKFTTYSEKDGLANNIVRAIYEDAEGALWIGMYDSGLYRHKGGQFTHYTMNEGLFDNGAFQIIEDEKNNFWISCNLGIYRVKKSELNDFAEGKVRKITAIPYNRRDGMLNSECNGGNQPAGIKARDRRIWFPTQKGVVVINPETVPFNTQPPPVVIESLIIDTKPVNVRSSINIEPEQTNLEIHYSGLSFINPELVKFKYKLEGLDEDWVEAATRRTAFYSHLPPGKYRFKVIAANRDGVWNEQGATIDITVLPPFYRTSWFLALAVFITAALAYTFYRRRIGRLTQAKAANEAFARQLIESQENERKRIAVELHDSLGQSLVLIKNWALLGQKAARQKKSVIANLDEISTTASEAINEVREIAYNLGPYQLDRIGLSGSLKEMIEKITKNYSIRFDVKVDEIDGCFTKQAEINIFRIAQEAVNNIVKHSGAIKASLTIKLDETQMILRIYDNGKGFDNENLKGNARRGFGLLGMSERMKLLGGEMKIESELGKGTAINIFLPCEGNRNEN